MVKRLASNYLQKKLYELLSAESLTVLDVVTKNDVLPYVIIGEDSEQKNKYSKDEDYKIIETSIEIFTEKIGFKDGKIIQEQIYNILDEGSLTLDNFEIKEIEMNTYSNSNSKEFLVSGIDLEITLKQTS